MHPLWRIVGADRLLVRRWDDEIVIFDKASGDTHYLDPAAAEVFELLIERPADNTTLMTRIAASLDVAPTGELDAAVDSIMKRFASAGLIEPVVIDVAP